MQKVLIGAESDLGVNIDGTDLGPSNILKNFNCENIVITKNTNYIKEKNSLNLRKNELELNKFNKKLYDTIINQKKFCLTIGGDHSISIASGLASLKKHKDIGIIWIDSHLDYNTFDTTITGNIHGLPLATLNGLNKDLSKFHNGTYYDTNKTVIIGYRSLEKNALNELKNIKKNGIKVYTTNDIKKLGIENVLKNAFNIANCDNQGVHISFDLDIIDPNIAPGVSIPEINGINLNETFQIINFLNQNKDSIKSFDLVEYNPLKDINNQTKNIALDIINKLNF